MRLFHASGALCAETALNQLNKKWIPKWRAASPDNSLNPAKHAVLPNAEPFYCLSMFPYPSGILHLGHQRVYTISDALARYKRLQGYDVVQPMGWDAFGLPAENAAVERGVNPAVWTEQNVTKMKEQMHEMLADFDWEREINTSEPDYYKWTQKIFTLLFEHGLAYRMGAEINWDPVDQTVLANEQVDADGRSWRSGALVEKRTLDQWFIGITKYAEQLQTDLRLLDQWPDKVKAMQKNWIGTSHGAEISFRTNTGDTISIFTLRPDTFFSTQFVALALNHPLVTKQAASDPKLAAFIADARAKDDPASKDGYRLPGIAVSLPITVSGEKHEVYDVPVFVAPFVIGNYGHGAVMGCPAHDERDAAFWDLHCPGIPAIQTAGPVDIADAFELTGVFTAKDGRLYDLLVLSNGLQSLGIFSGLSCKDAGEKITAALEAHHAGKKSTQFKIRDWLISRQRYWGAPIPIIHCDSCGPVAVPDKDLPVLLPSVDGQCFGKGNPLASIDSFVNAKCPSCGSAAKRETDTMDTFIDSSWYFFRYTDPQNKDQIFDFDKASRHMPVDMYLGGVEHAILHLMYSRFISKFLGDVGLWDGKDFKNEPIKRLVTQGMVHGETFTEPETGRFLKQDELDFSSGAPVIAATGVTPKISYEKMSKSKYNGVDPLLCISKYGADAVRAHILFSAPVTDVLNWNEEQIHGVERWLKKVLKLKDDVLRTYKTDQPVDKEGQEFSDLILNGVKHKSYKLNEQEFALYNEIQTHTKLVAKSVEDVSMNTLISDFMKMTNTLQRVIKEKQNIDPEVLLDSYKKLLVVMAPATPAVAEECWEGLCVGLGQEWKSIFFERFPECEPIVSLNITFKVIVNGKQRGTFKSEKSILKTSEEMILRHVYAHTSAEKFVAGKAIKKVIAKEGIISINTCK